jgi:putative transcriptional regulator
VVVSVAWGLTAIGCALRAAAAPAWGPYPGAWSTAAAGVPHTRPAKGRFLVASRSLSDPNFAQAVVLLLVYEERGAMGVIINRPSHVPLSSALPELEELRRRKDPVFFGGPVALDAALMLVRSAVPPQDAQAIIKDVYLSGSRAVLRQAVRGTGKGNRLRVYAGHAGWGAGQLDQEIGRGDWFVADADPASIFELAPEDVWPRLIEHVSGQWTRATQHLQSAGVVAGFSLRGSMLEHADVVGDVGMSFERPNPPAVD